MDVSISRSTIAGVAVAPASKSYSHRAIIAAGYGRGVRVMSPLISADTEASIRVVEAFGGDVRYSEDEGVLDIDGFEGQPVVPTDVIDCANSGTTIRLATAIAAVPNGISVLTGDESLRSRPQGPLLDAITQLGGRAESTRGEGQAPIVVKGPVDGGHVSIPGDVSSQFVTALLMMGAVTSEGITIELETELKSAPYVDVTREVLDAFGIETNSTSDGFHVDGDQEYDVSGGEYVVPGDFSSISYLLAAGALAGDEEVRVNGAFPTAQGDTAIVDILNRMGADIEWDKDRGEVRVAQSALDGITVDVGDTPDLLPTIATLGAVASGTTRIENCAHVRYKETDRVSAMAEELTKLGASVTEHDETLEIHGGNSTLEGTILDGRLDHRIIMSLAVAGLVAKGTTTITAAQHVDVSFPDFFDVLYDLGAGVTRQ